jgi:hypothetical protein
LAYGDLLGDSDNPPPEGWVEFLPDDIIDQNELDMVLGNWGSHSAFAASAAIPEPCSLVPCAISILLGVFAVRRRA